MKKTLLLLAVSSTLFLSGCQMTGSEDEALPTDFKNMSCEDIKLSLDKQKDTIENIETGSSFLGMVGMDSGTKEAKSAAVTAYQTSLKTAKPIIKVKNCKFKL